MYSLIYCLMCRFFRGRGTGKGVRQRKQNLKRNDDPSQRLSGKIAKMSLELLGLLLELLLLLLHVFIAEF